MADAIVGRTPIIVLANDDPFPKNDAFGTRMIKYVWQQCSELKKLKKKPIPIAIYHLFENYNISTIVNLEMASANN